MITRHHKLDFPPPDKHPGYKVKVGTITQGETYKFYNEAARQAKKRGGIVVVGPKPTKETDV